MMSYRGISLYFSHYSHTLQWSQSLLSNLFFLHHWYMKSFGHMVTQWVYFDFVGLFCVNFDLIFLWVICSFMMVVVGVGFCYRLIGHLWVHDSGDGGSPGGDGFHCGFAVVSMDFSCGLGSWWWRVAVVVGVGFTISALLACFQWFVWVSVAGGFGFVHGGDGGACDLRFGFYLGIRFEFQFRYWVLFGFELVAVAVGGEIGLPAMMRERVWKRDKI